jgi:hypothetical protein
MVGGGERMKTVNIDGKDYTYSESDVWKVEVGKGSKGAYHSRYTLDNPRQGVWYFNCINIGNGFKKRLSLVKIETGKKVTIVKAAS